MEKPLDRDIFSIRHLHVSHNAPYFPPPPPPPPPQNLWGGGGGISGIMGDVQVAFLQILLLIGSQKALLSLETLWRRGE